MQKGGEYCSNLKKKTTGKGNKVGLKGKRKFRMNWGGK